MRLGILTALLTVSTLSLAALGTGCSSSGGAASREDFVESSDDELTSTTNPMGLRLVYDDPSGHVHAKVKTKLLAGEKLMMRVRRGRLSYGEQVPLDCAQLALSPELPIRASYNRIVYDGPEVDRSLLANVYSQEWIDQNISQDVLQHLSREGADAIVEACIVGDVVEPRIRMQTSIQDAWDKTDPNAAPALRARGSVPAPP